MERRKKQKKEDDAQAAQTKRSQAMGNEAASPVVDGAAQIKKEKKHKKHKKKKSRRRRTFFLAVHAIALISWCSNKTHCAYRRGRRRSGLQRRCGADQLVATTFTSPHTQTLDYISAADYERPGLDSQRLAWYYLKPNTCFPMDFVRVI